ncbi:hypothetical protein ABES02_28495 [Neobacillus pocheonensis]|uniref:hypothetical protein n=1 Tax=Neobacillus pocheonensis TaxID=363869 RepID=UPI003D2D3EA2
MTPVFTEFLVNNDCTSISQLATKLTADALLKGTPYEGMDLHKMLETGEDAEAQAFTLWNDDRIVPKRITFSDWLIMIHAARLLLEFYDDPAMIRCDTYARQEDIPFGYRDTNIHCVTENYISDTDTWSASCGTSANRRYLYYIEDTGRYGVINENFLIL